MHLSTTPRRLLAWLSRHATRVLFAGVFLGLAVPPLAAAARPYLLPGVMVLLTAMLLRIDWGSMGAYLRRPVLATALVAWLLAGAPVVAWLILLPAGLPDSLTVALVLMAAAPPILSAAAIAVLLGLDGALAIVAGLIATLLTPLTVPPMALLLLGLELDISVLAFMGRLAAIVGPAFVLAFALRKGLGDARLARYRPEIEGFVVMVMLYFGVAIMDGVTARLLAEPAIVIGWTLAAFVANPLLQLLGGLAFAWLGRRGALTVGLISGNCNMGLLLAALPPGTDFDVLLYFAVAQLPIFMLPALMLPVYRRLLAAGAGGASRS
jgi:BASS family bile acid:Na+ symporter